MRDKLQAAALAFSDNSSETLERIILSSDDALLEHVIVSAYETGYANAVAMNAQDTGSDSEDSLPQNSEVVSTIKRLIELLEDNYE